MAVMELNQQAQDFARKKGKLLIARMPRRGVASFAACTSSVRTMIAAMAAGRVAIGATAVLVPGPSSRLLGYPREQDSPTARL